MGIFHWMYFNYVELFFRLLDTILNMQTWKNSAALFQTNSNDNRKSFLLLQSTTKLIISNLDAFTYKRAELTAIKEKKHTA